MSNTPKKVLEDEYWHTCIECNGTGYIHNGESFLDEENYEECENCFGVGEVYSEE